MRISDWSSDVCSSDLDLVALEHLWLGRELVADADAALQDVVDDARRGDLGRLGCALAGVLGVSGSESARRVDDRSEEHTSELQSLMRRSYAVFCLKKKNNTKKLMNTST